MVVAFLTFMVVMGPSCVGVEVASVENGKPKPRKSP